MLSGVRLFKQVVIAVIVLLIFGGAFYFVANKVSPPVATPTPDPRATLAPIAVIDTTLLRVGDNDYDVLVKVKNPNSEYGSPEATYTLSLTDDSGKEVYSNTDVLYIFPGQTKYVLVSPVTTKEPATKATLNITGVLWERLDTLGLYDINFVSANSKFSNVVQAPITGKAYGSIVNKSDYDIAQVDVVVVLQDADKHPIAANRSEIRTFIAKSTRGFESAWFSPIVGNVVSVMIEANANLFENANFLRTYGSQERFQQNY
mgnify:CR=1 FL=1